MDTTGTIAAVAALSLGAIGSLQHAWGKKSNDKGIQSMKDVISTLIALAANQDARIRQLEANLAGGQVAPSHGNGQVVTRLSVLEGQVSSLTATVGSIENDIDYLMNEQEEEVAPKIEKPIPARRTTVAAPAKRAVTNNSRRPGASVVQPRREIRSSNTGRATTQRRPRTTTPAPSDDDSVYGDEVDDSELLNAVSGR